MNTNRVDNQIVQAADRMSKDLHLNFRDCLDILIRAEARIPQSVEAVKNSRMLCTV